MLTIAVLCAAVFAFFACALIVPLISAFLNGEWRAVEGFLIVGISYGFVATALIMSLSARMRRLSRAGVFAAVACMWIALALAAALPFLVIERTPTMIALFEAVSAAITLGVSVVPGESVGRGMSLYRGMVAWQGGLLTLLIAVYVIGRYEVGGTPNRHLRYVLHSFESGDPRLIQTFYEVFVPYLATTLICAAFLVITRVAPADAFSVAVNIIATNGYVPIVTGATTLNNFAGEIVLMVFMLISATSIIWQRAILNRRWHQAGEQNETFFFLAFVAIVALVSATTVVLTRLDGLVGAGPAFFNVVFDTVSIMTTTGITHDQRSGVALPFELIMAIALVGGCAYSTAGGLKVFRLATMLHHSGNEIRRLVYPHQVLSQAVDSDHDELWRAKAVWSASFLALISLVAASILFSLQGIELHHSLQVAVGTFSATANLVEANMGPPSAGLLATIAGYGLAARIELLLILAAIGRNSW